tara:strand:+ start:20999 stop:21196 length:198 start_codon:yes stop_codon:yes gene_type:complete
MIEKINFKINLIHLIDHLSGSYSLFEKKGAYYFNKYIHKNNNIRKIIKNEEIIINIEDPIAVHSR